MKTWEAILSPVYNCCLSELHHHHVPEGLGVFPVPWSSRWSWSLHLFLSRSMFLCPFGLYCSACFGSLFVSILSLNLNHINLPSAYFCEKGKGYALEIFMSGCPSSRLLNQWADFYLWFEHHTIARCPSAIFVISCNSIITWQMQKYEMGTSLVPLYEGSGVMYGNIGKLCNFH